MGIHPPSVYDHWHYGYGCELKAQALPSEALVSYYITVPYHNPEEDLNLHRCGNLKSSVALGHRAIEINKANLWHGLNLIYEGDKSPLYSSLKINGKFPNLLYKLYCYCLQIQYNPVIMLSFTNWHKGTQRGEAVMKHAYVGQNLTFSAFGMRAFKAKHTSTITNIHKP